MTAGDAYDCQAGGACCVDTTGTRGYVRLAPREAARMRRLGLPVVRGAGASFLGPKADAAGRDVRAALAGAGGRRTTRPSSLWRRPRPPGA
jgi:hypothetical protein